MKPILFLLTLMTLPSIAVGLCDKNVSRPQIYMNILAPVATPEDLDQIAASEKPINPLANQNRLTYNLSARDGLFKVLAKLTPDEWEAIRQLAREAQTSKLTEAAQVVEAQSQTVAVFLNSYRFKIEPPGEFRGLISVLHSKDGRSYFAHMNKDERVRVHDELGNLIWTSPKIPFYTNQGSSEKRPVIISLLENENAEKRLEYYKSDPVDGDPSVAIFNFSLSDPSNTKAQFVARYPGQYSDLDFVKHMPDGRRFFFFRTSFNLPFTIQTEKGVTETMWTSPDDFITAPDGSILLTTWGADSGPYRFKNGSFEQLFKFQSYHHSAGSILLTKDGRLLVDHDNNNAVIFDALQPKPVSGNSLPKAKQAVSSFLESKNGRIFYARSGVRGPDYKPFHELYDVTTGTPVPLKFDPPVGLFKDVKLFESSSGPAVIFLTLQRAAMYVIRDQSLELIGEHEFNVAGNGRAEIITGPNKVFVLQSTKIGQMPESINVIQLYGKEQR